MWPLTNYLLKHRWQALILTFLITYIPVLGMASILIAALFTLCVGVFEGALFTLVATLPYILAFISGTQETEVFTLMVWTAVVLTVTSNILTFAFAVLLRRRWSWSAILQIAALLGVLVISVIHLAYPDVAGWWAEQITHFYNQSADMAGVAATSQAESQGATQLDTINTIKSFATGIVVSFVLFTAIIQVMLARWWQVVIVNRGRLGKEMHYIRLSRLAGVLFFASIIFCYLENRVVLDILPVLCLLFGAAGLSLIHYLCGLMEPAKGRFWLSIMYVALIYSMAMMAMLPLFALWDIMLPVVFAVLILAVFIFVFMTSGFLDVWFDLRKRSRKI
jgi:hypothetical protein